MSPKYPAKTFVEGNGEASVGLETTAVTRIFPEVTGNVMDPQSLLYLKMAFGEVSVIV